MKKDVKKLAIGTVIAAAVGYVAGILTAPKSGKETRKEIKDTTTKGITAAEKELKKLYSQLNSTITTSKTRLSKLSGKAQKDLKNYIDKGLNIQKKAREVLSAVHEGEPQDDKLEQALSETKKAITDLKAYLKK